MMERFVEAFVIRSLCWLLGKVASALWTSVRYLAPIAYSKVRGPEALETIQEGLQERDGLPWAQAQWWCFNAWSELASVGVLLWGTERLFVAVVIVLSGMMAASGLNESKFLAGDIVLASLALTSLSVLLVGVLCKRTKKRTR